MSNRLCKTVAFLSFYAVASAGVIDLSWWLRKSERKIFSQNGEDGILDALIDTIEAASETEIHPYFVEFGVENGNECNTRHLREGPKQWKGVLLDGSNENPSLNLHKRFITAENINNLLTELYVPRNLGVLSIDLDFNDFHVWRSILEQGLFRATITVIEMNSSIDPKYALTVPYSPHVQWDGTHFYGASLKALNMLAQKYGYALVACGE
jgi:hypothetical protein